jgi:FdhD protein
MLMVSMKSSIQLPVIKISGASQISSPDALAIEEPLEIRLAYGSESSRKVQNLAVTMRTPGNDAELASGFIFTEGIISSATDIQSIDHVFATCSEDRQNSIQVTLNATVIPNLLQAERNFYTTSSCGVCGKASINAIRTVTSFKNGPWRSEPICSDLIFGLPDILAKHQKVFADTGGLHAAALFNKNGELIFVREDVGRHNALDKLIGASLTEKSMPLTHSILLLSGRASFELVQKAAMAGIQVIAAVGAPSSLAVSLAEEFGITLVGFLRHNRFNIYSAAHRIKIPVHENTY